MTMNDDYYAYAKQWFDREAPVYWIFDRLVAGVRRTVVEVTDARPRSRVLDVATGTGEQAFAFAQRGHEVVGSTSLRICYGSHVSTTSIRG